MHRDLATGDVLVDLALHRLPAIGPEPGLLGWDGHMRMEFDDAVWSLDDLDLRTWLVEPVPRADVGRKRNQTSALQRDEVSGFHAQQSTCIVVIPQ